MLIMTADTARLYIFLIIKVWWLTVLFVGVGVTFSTANWDVKEWWLNSFCRVEILSRFRGLAIWFVGLEIFKDFVTTQTDRYPVKPGGTPPKYQSYAKDHNDNCSYAQFGFKKFQSASPSINVCPDFTHVPTFSCRWPCACRYQHECHHIGHRV